MTDEEGQPSTVYRPPRRLIEEREDALSLRRSFALKNKVNRKRSTVHRKRSAARLEEQGNKKNKVKGQRSPVRRIRQQCQKYSRVMEVWKCPLVSRIWKFGR